MQFSYRALKKDKIMNGKVEAPTLQEAIVALKNSGYFPIEVKKIELGALGLFDKASFNDIVDFTRQMAIMLNAGLTLIDCFDILKKQLTKPALLKIVETIDKEVRSGQRFSEALRKYPHLFSNLYISLVKSGEASGKLADILLKLSENLEKQREFKSKIKGALIYPVIVIVGMLGVMFIMITFVIPKLLNLYKDFQIQLPFTTRMLIAISDVTTKTWPLIIVGVVGAVILFKKYMATKTGKITVDSLMLNVPLFKNVVKMSVLVDSTRTLSILIGSGVSILEALTIIIETTSNMVFQKAFETIYKEVEKGISLGQALQDQQIFPPILVQMTIVGEQTGHLDETLGRISRYFEMESEIAVKTMTTLIEPLILVFLGVGVGFIVLSVITPIYNLTSSFK